MKIELLGDICTTTSGGTPSRANSSYFGGTIPWVKSGDLNDGEVITIDENITSEGLKNSSAKMLPKGTLLIAMYGATVGKLGFLGKEAATNQAICGISVPPILERQYLFYFLLSIRPQLIRMSAGGAQPNISQKLIRELRIPVPPIPEQRRVVDLLSRTENVVRMRLTAGQKAKEIIPALFLDMFGDPATNPKGWGTARLGDVADVVSGVAKGRKLVGKVTREVRYLRVANVQAGGLDLAEMKCVPATADEIAELAVRAGDVLLTEGGDFDKVGRGALLEADIDECIHQNHVFRVRTHAHRVMPEYFAAYLQTFAARQYFLKAAKKTSNLASINMTQLRNLPLPVPRLETQREFQDRFRDCRALEQQQVDASAIAATSFQSLIARVFSEGQAI